MARATSSFPEPLSPWMSTVVCGALAKSSTMAWISRMAGELPGIWPGERPWAW